jgi:glycosyltransferase involved in cell wall biosynthesis
MPEPFYPMKVSVVIITYNHEAFIAQALESVLMQELSASYEIVVGDDCSTDRTREIVRAYEEKYPDKIKLLVSERNMGDGGMTNFLRALRACRGQYISLLDGDDYWISDIKLEKQVQFLDSHAECSACTGGTIDLLEDGSRHPHPAFREGIYSLRDIVGSNFRPPFASTAMFRYFPMDEFLHWFFTSRANGDKLLLVANALRGEVGYFDEVMAIHRLHKQSVSLTRGHIQHVEKHLEKLKLFNTVGRCLNVNKTNEIYKGYIGLARLYTGNGNRRQAWESIKKGFEVLPGWRIQITRNLTIALMEIWLPVVARLLARCKRTFCVVQQRAPD